jgi:putative membrane protein
MGMTTDAWLAIAHHLAVFALLAVLAIEFGILRQGLGRDAVDRLARVDGLYGAMAGAVIVAGVARVVWGAAPADFYLESTTFWLKMASFAAVALISVRPTVRFRRWRRALDADPSALPSTEDVRWARRMVHLQFAVFALIPIFAALMARGIGA